MSVEIHLNDIQYQYTDVPILDINHVCFEKNISHAILGDNGSGKTTLLNLLSMVDSLQEGSIQFDSTVLNEANKQQFRKSVAYVQQKPFLFNKSVFENIELPLKLRGIKNTQRSKKTNYVIDQLSLSELAQRRANTLSGGEQQRVAIARALVTEPKLLLLDEPFSHLDKSSQKDIENIIYKLKNDKYCTVIVTLHDELRAHVLADRVMRIVNGKLLDSNIMNLFTGKMYAEQNVFDTGKVKIILPEQIGYSDRIAIDAKQLVLSKQQLSSSMRNEFRGKIVAQNEYQGQIQVSIEAGETFQCIITHSAMKDLNLHPGDSVWLYFKSSIVKTV